MVLDDNSSHCHLEPTEKHLHVGRQELEIANPHIADVERQNHSFFGHTLNCLQFRITKNDTFLKRHFLGAKSPLEMASLSN